MAESRHWPSGAKKPGGFPCDVSPERSGGWEKNKSTFAFLCKMPGAVSVWAVAMSELGADFYECNIHSNEPNVMTIAVKAVHCRKITMQALVGRSLPGLRGCG